MLIVKIKNFKKLSKDKTGQNWAQTTSLL